MNYNKYLQRVNTQSVDYLKKKHLMDRLKLDYNSEIITYKDNQYRVIIQTERTSDNDSYYKISALDETELNSGNVIFWDRVKRYFMIFFKRLTEKSYFIGRMYEAKYPITFLDNYNNKITQYGVIKSINDTIKDEDVGDTSVVAELIDGDMVLYLEKTNETEALLKRRKVLKIGDRNWKIVGWDNLTYENIIAFNLVEVLNYSEDTEELPYPELPDGNQATIFTNLDNITSLILNTTLSLKISTIFKNSLAEEEYEITCKNCKYKNNEIIFNKIGQCSISIKGLKTKAVKNYDINIQEQASENLSLRIAGRELVKISVPYSYVITLSNNGIEMSSEEFNEKYDISFEKDESVKIKKISSSEFFLRIENIGEYTIKITATNKETLIPITRNITITSEDLLS